MKKYFFTLFTFLIVVLISNAQKKSYSGKLVFEGDLSQLDVPTKNGMVMITWRKLEGGYEFDSVEIRNNKFTLVKDLSQPIIMLLTLKAPRTDQSLPRGNGNILHYFSSFLIPGKVQYVPKGVIDSAKISGTGAAAQTDYLKLYDIENKEIIKRGAVRASYGPVRANDKIYELKRSKSLDSIDYIRDETYFKSFVLEHLNSPVSLFVLWRYALSPAWESRKDMEPQKVEKLLLGLNSELRKILLAEKLSEQLKYAKLTALGNTAVEITAPDTSGKVVSLSSYKGKFVLVDFWASWCVPCRAENPNVLKAYNQYKNKNFTVLSVSLDRPDARAAWIKAIKDDNLPWVHISELEGFDGKAPKSYGVRSIPMNFLVDPSGKIIAKSLHAEKLQEKLEQVLN